MAIRKGPYKAHFQTRPGYGASKAVKHDPPLLFHLEHDPSERQNIAKDHPEVIQAIRDELQKHLANRKAPPSQLEIPLKRKAKK